MALALALALGGPVVVGLPSALYSLHRPALYRHFDLRTHRHLALHGEYEVAQHLMPCLVGIGACILHNDHTEIQV